VSGLATVVGRGATLVSQSNAGFDAAVAFHATITPKVWPGTRFWHIYLLPITPGFACKPAVAFSCSCISTLDFAPADWLARSAANTYCPAHLGMACSVLHYPSQSQFVLSAYGELQTWAQRWPYMVS